MRTSSPADQAYVLRLAARGLNSGEIFCRIMERLVWRGSYPSVDEIEAFVASRAPAGIPVETERAVSGATI
jgi:hypothetical protein